MGRARVLARPKLTRLVLSGWRPALGRLCLDEPVARHARVARVGIGDALELLDLAGTVGVATLVAWRGKACEVDVTALVRERGEPPAPLVLGLGVLHTQAFDWAVEKATECGATTIVPVLTARVQGGRHLARLDRWRRIGEAAVAQCGRSRAPVVDHPEPLTAFLRRQHGVKLVADPNGRWRERELDGTCGASVLVGPEGGFTPDEAIEIAAAGFEMLGLGNRTLRAETASVAALVLAQRLLAWL